MMGNKLVRKETGQQILKTVMRPPESRGKIYCQKPLDSETSLWLWVRALKSAGYIGSMDCDQVLMEGLEAPTRCSHTLHHLEQASPSSSVKSQQVNLYAYLAARKSIFGK